MSAVWDFIQYQVLGMQWLNSLIGSALRFIGLHTDTRLGGSVQFFLFDSIKIFVLLSVLIFVISLVESHFPPERCKAVLGRFHGVAANTVAALLGTVTPFCSCSSIPIFIGFTNAGLPLGVTFSFLISSPLVDLGSLILLMSVFGWEVAVLYVVLGVVLAVAGGTVIDKMSMEKYIEDAADDKAAQRADAWEWLQKHRVQYAWGVVKGTVKKVFWYVLVGVGIGAVIHNWIPVTFVETLLGSNNPFGVLLAVLVGVPMYADIFGTIPVAEALFLKGAGLGVILSFMMSVTALSLPSIIMLRRVVKPKLLALFVGLVVAGIILLGYLFNFLQPWLVIG